MRTVAVAVVVISACVALAAQAPASAPRTYDPADEVTYSDIITGVVGTNGADGTVADDRTCAAHLLERLEADGLLRLTAGGMYRRTAPLLS